MKNLIQLAFFQNKTLCTFLTKIKDLSFLFQKGTFTIAIKNIAKVSIIIIIHAGGFGGS